MKRFLIFLFLALFWTIVVLAQNVKVFTFTPKPSVPIPVMPTPTDDKFIMFGKLTAAQRERVQAKAQLILELRISLYEDKYGLTDLPRDQKIQELARKLK